MTDRARYAAWIVLLGFLAGCSVAAPLPEPPDVPSPDSSALEPQVAEKIRQVQQIVRNDPKGADSWGRLGLVFHAHGLEPEAATCYEYASQLDPREFRWHYRLAFLFRQSDIERSAASIERALELNDDYAPSHVLLAELLERQAKVDEAVLEYRKALVLDPRCTAAELGLGRLSMGKGEFDESLRHLERARELQQDAQPVRSFLARLYHRLGREQDAAAEAKAAANLTASVRVTDPVMEPLVEENVSAPGLLRRARRAEQAQDLDSAEALYRELIEFYPDNASMYYNMGNLLFRNGRLEEAEPFLRQALQLNPSHAAAHIILGSLLVGTGRDAEGITHFEKPVELGPEHAAVLNNLGMYLAREGRTDLAIYFLEKVVEIEPESVGVRRNLGQILAVQRRFDEAIVHYKAAVQASPESGELHRDLALFLTLNGKHREAWTHVHAAQDLGETVPPSLLETLAKSMPDPGRN